MILNLTNRIAEAPPISARRLQVLKPTPPNHSDGDRRERDAQVAVCFKKESDGCLVPARAVETGEEDELRRGGQSVEPDGAHASR